MQTRALRSSSSSLRVLYLPFGARLWRSWRRKSLCFERKMLVFRNVSVRGLKHRGALSLVAEVVWMPRTRRWVAGLWVYWTSFQAVSAQSQMMRRMGRPSMPGRQARHGRHVLCPHGRGQCSLSHRSRDPSPCCTNHQTKYFQSTRSRPSPWIPQALPKAPAPPRLRRR